MRSLPCVDGAVHYFRLKPRMQQCDECEGWHLSGDDQRDPVNENTL